MRTLFLLFFVTTVPFQSMLAQSFYGEKDIDSGLAHTYRSTAVEPARTLAVAKAIQLQALRKNDSLLFAKALINEGKAHFYLGDIAMAIATLNEALSTFQKYNEPQGLLTTYYELAVIETAMGSNFQALVKLKNCLRLAENLTNNEWQAKALYQVALINFRQNELPLAWERSEKALGLVPNQENTNLKGYLFSLQGLILLKNEELNAASDRFDQAKNWATKSSDSVVYIPVYHGLGSYELERGNFIEALRYSQNALRIAAKMGDPSAYPQNLVLLSRIYVQNGEKSKGLQTAQKALTVASKLENMPALQKEVSQNLADAFLANGDSAKAYTFGRLARQIQDSELADHVNKYVLQPNESTAGAVDQASENKTGEKKKPFLPNENQASLVIIGALLLICALLSIALLRRQSIPFTNSKRKRGVEPEDSRTPVAVEATKSALTDEVADKRFHEMEAAYQERLKEMEDRLDDQEQRANKKQEELDAQNKHYEEMDKTKTKVFSVLTHDLRQPINQIKSVLNLLEMEELDGADRREIVEKLKESVDNSSNALENLLLWSKKQLTGINTRIVDVHLLPQVWQLESHLKPNMEAKELKLEIKIPDFFKVKADMNQLDICLRNLVTNAMKFSNRGGTITIDAIEENDQKIVRVIDQGVGMTAEQLEKLRNPKENFSTLGTMNEKGTGLGILITREFMENQEGRLEIMSRKGEGSIFSLIFSSGSASRAREHSELQER